MRDPRRFVCLSSILLSAFAACGGGGGSSDTPSSRSVALLVDTSAGSPDYLRARLAAVALEDASGSLTANLLVEPSDSAILFIDPTGAPSGLSLQEPAERPYVALSILLVPDSVRAQRADGTGGTVATPRADLRVAFDAPWRPSGGRGLLLRHRTPVDLSASLWSPDLSVETSRALPLPELVAVVQHVDPAAGRLVVTLPGLADRAVDVVVDSTAFLSGVDGARRSSSSVWLGELTVGSTLTLRGVLDDGAVLRCAYGSHRRRGGDDRGGDGNDGDREGKLIGRITSVDATASTFTMGVQALVRRGDVFPPPRTSARVDASRALIHHSGFRHEPLSFATLAVGQLVEVEGFDVATAQPILAFEVEIEDGRRGDDGGDDRGNNDEIEGAVGSVDVAGRRIVVVPHGDDPLIVGGRSVPSVELRVDAATAIYRKTDSGLVPTGLEQIRAGERIDFRGLVIEPQTVRATWVRVRDR